MFNNFRFYRFLVFGTIKLLNSYLSWINLVKQLIDNLHPSHVIGIKKRDVLRLKNIALETNTIIYLLKDQDIQQNLNPI